MKNSDVLLLWTGVLIFLLGIVLDSIPLFGIGFAWQCLFYEYDSRKSLKEETNGDSDDDSDSD